MSGSPKMVTMYLEGQGYVTVTEAQARELERAERARRKAAEQEQARQLHNTRQQILDFAEEVRQALAAARGLLPAGRELSYESELNRLAEIVRGSSELAAVNAAQRSLIAMRMRLEETTALEERRAEAAALAGQLDSELAGFDKQLNQLREQGGTELDERGRSAALGAVNACRALTQVGEHSQREAAHATARRAIEAHASAVQQAREQRALQLAETQALLGEAQQQIAGLRADELAARWAGPQTEELAARVAGWEAALAAGDFAALNQEKLDALRRDEAALLERVAAAQLKAETRDYIASSVREVLSEMGFMLSAATEEHPGHPASAITFRAVNAAGQSIGVSVPVDGQVWYDIDGYPKTTEAMVGGGAAAVCDTAQAVIEEMHSALAESHGVQSGELMWEGKDPLRLLRQADQLPKGLDAAGRENQR